jgi:hypothetical protein
MDQSGNFSRNYNKSESATWAAWGKLHSLGLSCYPQAFVKAVSTFVLPSLLFGASVWGAKEVRSMLLHKMSPYTHPAYKGVIKVIKSVYGLQQQTFNAPLYKMLNIKSFLATVLPQLWKLVQ